jgi:hypothetical protein
MSFNNDEDDLGTKRRLSKQESAQATVVEGKNLDQPFASAFQGDLMH